MTDEEIIEELNTNWNFIETITAFTNNTKTECFLVSRFVHKTSNETIFIVCDKNVKLLGISKDLNEANAYASELAEDTSARQRSGSNWWWN